MPMGVDYSPVLLTVLTESAFSNQNLKTESSKLMKQFRAFKAALAPSMHSRMSGAVNQARTYE